MNARELAGIVPLIIAVERVAALGPTLSTVNDQVTAALEVAPDLAPELTAIQARVNEALDHVIAAQAVLAARVDLMKDAV